MTQIVFLPGLLCTELLFSYQQENLAGNYSSKCLVLPDGITMEEISGVLWEGISGSVILVGLSMGGIAAMEMYRQHPDRISGMVFLDTNCRDEVEAVSAERYKLVELAKKIGPGEMSLRKLLPFLVHPSRTGDPLIRNAVYDMAEKYGLNRLRSHAEALSLRRNYSGTLGSVNCPVLIIHGKEDKLCPKEYHQHIKTLISKSRRIEIDNCGHLSSLEKHDLVSTHLNTWLSRYFPL
ncbi:MAG: alpha/beta hydrolase [Spirochaetia bacterium]|jgi:pimeloyl-ACP methyl ester carboxylesterase|nr:alpha/beta hydrolase [Spirochaetia bacterium]